MSAENTIHNSSSIIYNYSDTPCQLDPGEEEQLNSKEWKLNERQEQFCHEYLKDFNGAGAASRCGYKPYGAAHTAYRLLHTKAINKRIHQLKKEQRQHTHISFDYVVQRLIRIADDAMEGDPILVYDQSAKTWKDTDRRKPDRSAAIKALTLLGKHTGMFDKDFTHLMEKTDERTEESLDRHGQLLDSYIDTTVNLQEAQKENERLKAALTEAGIELKPKELTTEEIKALQRDQNNQQYGSMRALYPSEYDEKPHYKYKRILPHKNHPEHQLVTEEQMQEAIRKKMEQHLAANKNGASGS